METKQYGEQANASSQQEYMHVLFKSDEQMKEFYLTMARVMEPRICLIKMTEAQQLKILLRTFRRSFNVMQGLGNYSWSDGVAEIQAATGVYMMQPLERMERLRSNKKIGNHLQMITWLTSSIYIVKRLEGTFNNHCAFIEYLLKNIYDGEKESSPY